MAKDVKRYSVRVTGFAAHLAKVEAGDSDGMVDNNLVVIPTLLAAHGAIEVLKIGAIIFRFPSFFFRDQLACPRVERKENTRMGRPIEIQQQCGGSCLRLRFGGGQLERRPAVWSPTTSPI